MNKVEEENHWGLPAGDSDEDIVKWENFTAFDGKYKVILTMFRK